MSLKLPTIVNIQGPPPPSVLDSLKGLVGRKADAECWHIVDRLRELAQHTGEIDDPEVQLRLRFLDAQRNLYLRDFPRSAV